MAVRTSTTRHVHAHGCTRCKARYEDACFEPNNNGLCSKCDGPAG